MPEPRRISPREIWLASLLYAVATLAFAYPLSIHPGSSVMSRGTDTDLFMWMLGWNTYAFTHQPFSIFDANIFFPLPRTLAFSENLIGSGLLAAPILWISDNPVLAMNLVALVSAPLCGLGAYLLGRELGMSGWGAAVCGMVFGFSPPRFLRLDQLHLTCIQWIPFCLAFLHAYLDRGRRRDLWLAVGFFTLQVLTTGHGAVFLAISIAGLLAYRFLLGDPIRPVKRLMDLGLPGIALLVPAFLMFLPYMAVQAEMGLRRTLEGWGMTWTSFLASPAHFHTWVLSFFPNNQVNETAWAYLYPGYLPLLLLPLAFLWPMRRPDPVSATARLPWRRLAVVLEIIVLAAFALALYVTIVGPVRVRFERTTVFSAREPWRAWLLFAFAFGARLALRRIVPFAAAARLRSGLAIVRDRRERLRLDPRWFYLFITVIGIWLSMGPPYGLWQHVFWMPVFNFIRAQSRFMLLAVLGFAVLSGIAFERITSWVGPTARMAIGIVALVLLFGEFIASPLGTVPYRVEIPEVDRWLDTRPKPFAVAEVPLRDTPNIAVREERQTLYMLHAMAHWQKTIHGYSGLLPGFHDALYHELYAFPDEVSVTRLREIGVDYVVVHTDLYPPEDWAKVEARLAAFGDRLVLEHTAGAGRVYSINGSSSTRAR